MDGSWLFFINHPHCVFFSSFNTNMKIYIMVLLYKTRRITLEDKTGDNKTAPNARKVWKREREKGGKGEFFI